MKGRGPFWQDLKAAGKKLAALGLREVGQVAGAQIGAPGLGRAAGAAVSRFFGFGPYGMPWSVSQNSVMRSETGIPRMESVRDVGFNIKHTEFLGVVTSTSAFNLTTYPLQPGLGTTFPWASNIAENFSEYRINGAVIVFKSNLTDAVASFSSLGTVSIAADMNAAAAAPISFQQLEQLKYCLALKPSNDGYAPIECDPKMHRNQYFVRTGNVPSGASVNDYDHCQVFVATYGMPSSGVVIGRLYITYDITLMEPKLLSTASTQLVASATCQGITSTNLFSTAAFMVNSLGISVSGNTITIPSGISGVISFAYAFYGSTGVTPGAIPTLTYANCSLSTYAPFATATSALSNTSCVGPPGTGGVSFIYRYAVLNPSVATVATITFPASGVVPASGSMFADFQAALVPVPTPAIMVEQEDIDEEKVELVAYPSNTASSASGCRIRRPSGF